MLLELLYKSLDLFLSFLVYSDLFETDWALNYSPLERLVADGCEVIGI